MHQESHALYDCVAITPFVKISCDGSQNFAHSTLRHLKYSGLFEQDAMQLSHKLSVSADAREKVARVSVSIRSARVSEKILFLRTVSS